MNIAKLINRFHSPIDEMNGIYVANTTLIRKSCFESFRKVTDASIERQSQTLMFTATEASLFICALWFHTQDILIPSTPYY